MEKIQAFNKLKKEFDKLDILWAIRKITKKQWERHEYLKSLLTNHAK